MEVFEVTEDDDWPYNYDLVGSRKWCLPGVQCLVCGRTWGAVGAIYPNFKLPPDVDEKPYQTGWPVFNDEFAKLREPLRKFWRTDLPLPPGTQFGPLSGKGFGKFGDITWLHSWVPLIHEDALEELRQRGIHTLVPVTPQIRLRSKREFKHLELHIEPHVEIDLALIPSTEMESCEACGWFRLPERKFPTPENAPRIKRSSIPRELDLFRVKEHESVILATARFTDAVKSLGLSNIKFQPYRVSEN